MNHLRTGYLKFKWMMLVSGLRLTDNKHCLAWVWPGGGAAWWREEPSVGPSSHYTIVFPANAGSTQATGGAAEGITELKAEGDI